MATDEEAIAALLTSYQDAPGQSNADAHDGPPRGPER
jgi:hypothetical protein